MSERIWIFQYLVASGEMDSLIECVQGWTENIREAGGSFETMKNCLFSHTFRINCVQLRNFSEELFDLFIRDYHGFKNLVHTFLLRIIKHVVCDVVSREMIKLDLQQLRICYEPINFPSEMAEKERNGFVTVGSHCYIEGKVYYIDDVHPLVIRSFFRCRNAHCGNGFYLKPKECFGAIHCRRCGELASEDETGRVFVMSRHISVITEGKMVFGPIDIMLKGSMCDYQLRLGENISVFGILSTQTLTSVRVNATRIARLTNFGECAMIEASFAPLLDCLFDISPEIFPPIQRIIFSAACVATMGRSLLIEVRTVEDMKYLIEILDRVFGDKVKVFFPSKRLLSGKGFPSMLSCDGGIIVVPHINLMNSVLQQKFTRVVVERSVSGHHMSCAVVGIYVSPTLSALDTTPFGNFHIMIRLETLPRAIVNKWLFGDRPSINSTHIMLRVSAARQLLETINVSDEADGIISQYISYCKRECEDVETEMFVEMAFAVAAFRQSPYVCPVDVYMAIYLFEETKACFTGSDNFLSQLPTKFAFFTATISSVPVDSESSLFETWMNYVTRTMSS